MQGLEKMKTAYDELRKQMRSMRMPPSRTTSSADSNTRDGDLKFDITTEEKVCHFFFDGTSLSDSVNLLKNS